MDTITKVGKLGPAKKSPSSRKRGNYKGKSVKKQQDNLKVVYISTPMKVKTHASKFREIVQELTGKYSDVARIMEATGGGCGGTDDTYWTIDNEHQQPLMKPELQQPLSIETGTGADGFFHLMVDNDHYYSQSPSTTVDDRTPSASVSEESTSPPASVLMYDESQQQEHQYYNLGDDLIKTAESDYDGLVVMGVDDDGDLLTGGGQFNYLEFLSDDYQSSQEDDLDVLGKY